MNTPYKSVTILIAEDDPDDRLLTEEALRECRLINTVKFVENGEELLDYLHQRGRYHNPDLAPWPDLILLDLNMPRKGGREVLEEMKAQPELRTIPVVVLTTSKAEEDVLRTYDLGVSSFVTKPVTFEELRRVMHTLQSYWFEIVTLPPKVIPTIS